MKKTLTTSLLLLAFTCNMLAQEIEMELYLSTPDIQGSDGGDSQFLDIDNDGDNDMIIAGRNGATLTTLYRNDGEGNFTETNAGVFTGVAFGEIVTSDVDADGDIDLFIMGQTQGGLNASNLFFNDGTGTFTLITSSNIEALSGDGAEFGDIDNDGDDDLIISGYNDASNQTTKMYTNDGQGVFTLMSTPQFDGLSGRYRFIDYDNDDDIDVIFTGSNETEIPMTNLYTNNGSGVFSIVANTGLNNLSGGDIAVGDTDDDGDLDILICGADSENEIITQLFINDGSGNFELIDNTIFNDAAFGEASFNDFDNDGDLDAFVIGTGNGGLVGEDGENTILGSIYQNEGDNNFILAQEIIGGYFSHHAVADIDGNDTLDLVLGGTTIGDPARGSFLYKNITKIILGAQDHTLNSDFILHPNPAQNSVTIETAGNKTGTIEIYSALGQLVHSALLSENKIPLNLTDGTYFVNLKTNDNYQVKKLIIKK